MADIDPRWQVTLSSKCDKQKAGLPTTICKILTRLIWEIESSGPIRKNWKNFGELFKDTYHCHLKKGRPTYVACWRVNKNLKIVEIYYVGTHENSPY